MSTRRSRPVRWAATPCGRPKAGLAAEVERRRQALRAGHGIAVGRDAARHLARLEAHRAIRSVVVPPAQERRRDQGIGCYGDAPFVVAAAEVEHGVDGAYVVAALVGRRVPGVPSTFPTTFM